MNPAVYGQSVTLTAAVSPARNYPVFAGGVLVVADVNNDGKPDLVVFGDTWVSVLLGNGDGSHLAHGRLQSRKHDRQLDCRPQLKHVHPVEEEKYFSTYSIDYYVIRVASEMFPQIGSKIRYIAR